MDTWTWVDWFQRNGYLVDGRPTARPNEPTVLCRGCGSDWVHRMAWTRSAEVADYLAHVNIVHSYAPGAGIYRAVVAPGFLLAEFTGEKGRVNEVETVIYPDGLDAVERIS